MSALPLAGASVDYARDIQPIFAEHCLECHGPDDSKGGLTLTSREQALKALESGAHGIVPGKPEQSEVVARVTSDDPDEQMPPPKHRAKKPITQRETELLRQWIAEGAKYELHWAYKPVVKPAVPKFDHPVDSFVRTRLAAEGLKPSPEADRITLIRRVHYDLLGLPPTPEEVDSFVADKSPAAYESMLDQALASPHFGERWGRHWLDMARYADSDGYEKDRPRPDAWRYRDWVIRAINNDLPFDQFTIEQLAGDLLPNPTPEQIVATAFNRQTLTNTEGGTDQEQFRIEACMDRTETVGAVWLGLTVGCARCHTHKYDQITHREYFQLFAYFNNGDEVVRQAPVSPEEWSRYEKANGASTRKLIPLQKALDEARTHVPETLPQWEPAIQTRLKQARENQAIAAFAPVKITTVKSKAGSTFKILDDGSVLASGKQANSDRYTLEIQATDQPVYAIQIQALAHDTLPGKGPGRSPSGNFVLSEVSLSSAGKVWLLHSPSADFEQSSFKATATIDGKPDTGWAVKGKLGKSSTLTIQLAEPIPPKHKITLHLDQNYGRNDHNLGCFRVLASSVETEDSIAPAAVVKILDEEPRRRNPVVIQALYDWMEKTDPRVIAAASALKAAQDKLPAPPLMDVRVLAQRKDSRQTHILYRGDFLQPTNKVVPATLDVLPKKKAANGTRLDLAKWLVSRDNPLTSRVTVNHIWGKLFGEGLVKTSADFGVRGDRPTHPELLDWLAADFMDQKWSRKTLIKNIMMSDTYRQQSRDREEASAKDPKNELLWKQNRLRVEAEIMRDLGLATSGLLAPKVGGPSVFPPMPADVAALSYANNFKWTTSPGEDRYRRGLYTFFKRTSPYPDLTTFDCPDSNVANVKRTVSNTPLQALTTLNAQPYNESAQALARRVLQEEYTTDAERLTRAFRLCVSRIPAPHELNALSELLKEARYHYQSSAEEAKTSVGAYTVKDIPDSETAAWIATTRILLNMDEFITRE
ncbi:cytochrome c [Prosthecobacter fusiformis]|uniref:Cytochrome c n=1 Tax=Prosthecobacter fusiformis TaxID=48464 RepID=A0A4R7RK82_9BACT|nr:PSD1 and planctomycete cytochrome C domain-containing protein [Prosthecobacter fusiformis]TDU64607.1 cytochrome c [Prosthecobacter fusiformis]